MFIFHVGHLLEPVGRTISLETLEGSVLAIDISIWLTQFVKAMRDEDGKLVKNAHVIGSLRRILKLMHYKIKPVFVFDGETPALKVRTVKRRRVLQEQSEGNYKKAAERILLLQMKQRLLSPPPSVTAGNLLPTFFPLHHESVPAKEDAGGCRHAPAPGSRVTVLLAEGTKAFGKVVSVSSINAQSSSTNDPEGPDIAPYRFLRSSSENGNTFTISVGDQTMQFDEAAVTLIEPCRYCFPPEEAQKSPVEAPAVSRKGKRKRVEATSTIKYQGRLYDSDSEEESRSEESEHESWILPAGEIDLDVLGK